jgi:hypothetical protein
MKNILNGFMKLVQRNQIKMNDIIDIILIKLKIILNIFQNSIL